MLHPKGKKSSLILSISLRGGLKPTTMQFGACLLNCNDLRYVNTSTLKGQLPHFRSQYAGDESDDDTLKEKASPFAFQLMKHS